MDPQRIVFLPLKNLADSNAINDISSIFDFEYGTGMDFRNVGNSNLAYKIYYVSDHRMSLSEKEDTTSRIYWAFAKLKYHVVVAEKSPSKGELFHFTLFNKNGELPTETYNFGRLAVDTTYFKKKYVAPAIDTAELKLKKNEKSKRLWRK